MLRYFCVRTLLKDKDYFKTVKVDNDMDTIVWDNGADLSPDFLYKIGELADNQVYGLN
jgi:hypothetical protein